MGSGTSTVCGHVAVWDFHYEVLRILSFFCRNDKNVNSLSDVVQGKRMLHAVKFSGHLFTIKTTTTTTIATTKHSFHCKSCWLGTVCFSI